MDAKSLRRCFLYQTVQQVHRNEFKFAESSVITSYLCVVLELEISKVIGQFSTSKGVLRLQKMVLLQNMLGFWIIVFLQVASITHSTGMKNRFENIMPQSTPEEQVTAVKGLISRLIPSKESLIKVTVDPKLDPGTKDTVQIKTNGAILYVDASSGVAASLGLHHYLKYYCNCHVSWSGVQMNVPSQWPTIHIKMNTLDRFAYYLNVCTESYSMVWWNWTRWEQEIDWMALNGINLPLAFTGQEAILKKTFMKFGMNETEVNSYFAGPAFLAWNRMGNIKSWAGPLPNSWQINQQRLQHKILKRMRSFGMTAVLPGFNGYVPPEIKRNYPKSKIFHLKHWDHFIEKKYSGNYFLDPTDPLFKEIASNFTTNIIEEFGTDHIYNIDMFNEMSPFSSSSEYLEAISRAVYESIAQTDSKAIWLNQGWKFYNDGAFWKQSQVKAFLTAVPMGKMIVLDLTAEQYPQYLKFESFYGQPFIWCMLNNYGATHGLFGNLDFINKGPFKARTFPNSSMIGTGISPEGIGKNYIMYDLMSEMKWRTHSVNLTKWVSAYCRRRYGSCDHRIEEAWHLLQGSVYNSPAGLRNHGKYIMVKRPSLTKKPLIWYNVSDVFNAWKYFNSEFKTSTIGSTKNLTETFSFDLVDIVRQSLQIIFAAKYKQLISAYKNNSTTNLQIYSEEMLEILQDLDEMLMTNKHYLLGVWISNAKVLANNTEEGHLYEMNARNQISLWGPNGEELDYAVKQWSGVAQDYFKPRWKLFNTLLISSVRSGSRFPSKYFLKEVFNRVEKPFSFSHKQYRTEVKGSPVNVSHYVYKKYKSFLQEASKILQT